MTKRIKAGVVGCGCISAAYFEGSKPFKMVEIVACADIQMDRAKEKANEYGIARACTVEEMMKDPEVQIVYEHWRSGVQRGYLHGRRHPDLPQADR